LVAQRAAAANDYRLLGPSEAGVDGRVLAIGGHKQLALLAVLVFRADQPVSRDVLVDWLWGEHPPPGGSGRVLAELIADGPGVPGTVRRTLQRRVDTWPWSVDKK
jgi:hypothetical protein